MPQSIGLDALKITLSKIITLTISMITTMLLSRYLSLKDYGTYSQIILIVSLVSTLFAIGLPSSINYFAAKTDNPIDRQKYFSNYYSISTILSIFAGFFLFISSPILVSYFENPILVDFIYILIILPWAKIISSSITNVLVVYNKTNYLMLFQSLHSIFLLTIILLAKNCSLDFNSYMFLNLCVEIIFSFSVYIIVKHISGKLIYYLEKSLIKEIFKFSIPIGLATVVGTISIELDKMIIARYFSVEQLAIYANASREMPVTFISSSITSVLLPNIVRKLNDNRSIEAVKLWGDASVLSYIIISFFTTVLFIYAPEVITFLYSDKYLPGVSVFRVYSIVLLLRFTYFGMILNSAGRTKFILYSSIGSLLLNIVLNVCFYKAFGFIGPAIATFVSIFIVNVVQLIVSSRVMKISFNHIMPWNKLLRITLINFSLGYIIVLLDKIVLSRIVVHKLFELIIVLIVWSIVYFVIVRKDIIDKWKLLN